MAKNTKKSPKTPTKQLKLAKKWPKYHSNHQNYSPIEAPGKIAFWISEKNRQNGKKCHKIAITTQKICKKIAKNSQKMAKHDNEKLKVYCIWTPIVDCNLRSIQYTCYLPKNGLKISKIWQKWPKMAEKGWFCTSKFSQKEWSSAFFFQSISLACLRRAIWTPKVLSETLFSWRYVWHNIAPFYNISQKSNFFTDQDMIEAIAQNCAKTKCPTKKINKSNFEVHGLTSILHLLTLMGVLRKGPQFSGQNRQNLHFLKFLKKRKMANFKLKNLCDKSLKIKNLRWQFFCIFRCLLHGALCFFCRRCFHGEIWQSKLPVLKIFKKV